MINIQHFISRHKVVIMNYLSFFVDEGTEIFLKEKHGANCLHLAAANGHSSLCTKIVKKHKFDVLTADKNDYTPLHYSALNENYELVKFFAHEGADILLKTKTEANYLHLAANDGDLNLCKTFVNEHKFDVHIGDDQGFTALHFSAEKGNYELVNIFVDEGADILLKAKIAANCLHLAAANGPLNFCNKLVKSRIFDVLTTNNGGWTPFHYSALNGNYELFKFFMEEGTDIFLKAKLGINCLHLAAAGAILYLY